MNAINIRLKIDLFLAPYLRSAAVYIVLRFLRDISLFYK